MPNRSVLISGAGVTGLSLAYWLRRRGFRPTLVERSPGPRGGGQAIDVRGAALRVVARMGLLEPIRAAKTDPRGMSFVDSRGEELSRSTEATLTGGLIDNDDVEIMRDDLAALLSDAGGPGAEYLFGDVITSLTQRRNDVEVTFRHGPARRFDLVLGADGLHSGVRRLAFGPEAEFVRFLGSYFTIFTVDNFLGLDRWQMYHAWENGLIGVYSARHNTEARAMLRFASQELDFDHHDVKQQQDILAEHFAGAGWETPRLLERMRAAPDFFFDSTSQVCLDRWSDGRVALVGDAAYCASPRAGQGTSMALVGAYVLAGELAKDTGDHQAAFARYQDAMRGYVGRNQQLARDAAAGREVGPADRADAAVAITLEDYPG
ncbi:FAD-dependent monooxygenase [Amycolatopsis saalfeldensis]|uniref:2-polyprenyl-6-methoxyphenol hydroxylase n=1 Tax=Amycolatopsis saalfeldensis TaxID=394193 RepID=A0A1H8XHA9_9PSEU|nr:FAD-dependent monooxygenase [Amycolatopsis saalfeldensis]SEP39424.1 2-polyprenyl-6-methoxyphenol hydroxylase [Amycolatopsis saalfeldensis]